MLHDKSGHISVNQSGTYLEKQFHQSLKKAFNPKRRTQCQSIIISFSDDEFDTSDLSKQASQALQLVQGYVHQNFSDAQTVSCVQCDGQGGRLHVHLLINAVKPSGKTIPTNKFSVFKMRRNLDSYLSKNFQRITGRNWINPFENDVPRKDLKNLPSKSVWQDELKQIINTVKQEVTNARDFINKLASLGVTVTDRQHHRSWTYHQTVQTSHGEKKLSARDFYQRRDKETGQVLTTRGLGTEFTKQALEKFWQKQLFKEEQKEDQLQPLQLVHGHNKRKEVDNNGHSNREDEQRQRIRTLAAEARFHLEHQRELQQLTLRQLRAAKAEEKRQQRQAQRQTGRNPHSSSQGKHNQSITEQERLAELARQRINAKQQNGKSAKQADAGPEL